VKTNRGPQLMQDGMSLGSSDGGIRRG